jgi:molybdopterin converting factor small subunit
MSFNESPDHDLVRQEAQQAKLREEQDEALEELKENLQEAFGKVNEKVDDNELIHGILGQVVLEFYDGYSIEIKDTKYRIDVTDYNFKELR